MSGPDDDDRHSKSRALTGDLKSLLALVASGRSLSEDEAETAFDIIMSGDATPSQMGGFLMALRVRGETVDEIAGAARVMRAKAVAVDAPPGTVDTCGTGGDSSGSFNISTASALVVAGCGVPVAKHGNRALSSKSGVGRRADRAWGRHRRRPLGRARLLVGDRHRLFDGAAPPQRHPPCGPDPGRARHPDDLQPPGAAVEPGRRAPSAGRRLRARMGRADGRGAGPARRRARLGRAWRRARRIDHRRPDDRRGAPRRQRRDLRGHGCGCRAAAGAARRAARRRTLLQCAADARFAGRRRRGRCATSSC